MANYIIEHEKNIEIHMHLDYSGRKFDNKESNLIFATKLKQQDRYIPYITS